jgi:surface carbohydrate biosynthesis protein
MNIALPIETKVRELDGKIWLALNLIKQGHKIALGRRGSINYSLDKIKPEIYIELDAEYSPKKLERVKKLSNSGTKVYVLETEGGVFRSEEEYSSNRLSKKILQYIDKYLAWGQETYDIIKHNTDFPEENTAVTGNPRFDLLSEELREIYATDTKKINQKYNEYILINTNFTYANNKDITKLQESLKNRGRNIDEKRVRYEKNLLNEFTTLVSTVTTKIDKNIVIRPHPSESLEKYQKEFENFDQVYACRKGDVRPWISGSQAVIHNSCTTGIESALLNVPVFAYQPITNERYDVKLPNIVSNQIYSIENIINKLRQITEESKYIMTSKQHRILKKYFYNIDSQAAKKIRQVINKENEINLDNFRRFASLRKKSERLFKKTFNTAEIKNHLAVEGGQKFPDLTEPQLRNKIQLYDEFIDGNSIVVEQIEPWKDAYWLYSP